MTYLNHIFKKEVRAVTHGKPIMTLRHSHDKNDGRWSLDALYRGLDDPTFQEVMKRVTGLIDAGKQLARGDDTERFVVDGLTWLSELEEQVSRLAAYLSLRAASNTNDTEAVSHMTRLRAALAGTEERIAELRRAVANLPDLNAFVRAHPEWEAYHFLLKEQANRAAHSLSPEMEEMIARMNLSGGSAWGRLSDYLPANLRVRHGDDVINLSAARNLASHPDRETRRTAYEAELEAYPAIEDAMAFALNSIKSQVKMLATRRGYDSPLDETLQKSRMKRDTLEAMFEAMREHFDVFRRYLKAKEQLISGESAMPWYDLVAPVGATDRRFTVDEARDYLLTCFDALHPPIAEVMKRAFDENWIDFFPREGKVGGAFCYNLGAIGQSRVLTNFDGTFHAVGTLAHELGHAYHGFRIESHRPLNRHYTMPVAETASTFNEIHLSLSAFRAADSDAEKIALLDGLLSGMTQTLLDIYSRFLFEDEVFARCDSEFLPAPVLCDIMLRAQAEAYGEALDPDRLHPWMWACKSHYYSPDLSYYNFPYAFGALFAMGIYTLYETRGHTFMESYDRMLTRTTVATVEDVAAVVDIDLTHPDFWQKSLDRFGTLVDAFIDLGAAQ